MTKPALPTRLLVVHPDAEARTFLRRRFSRLGYEVEEAGSPEAALPLIAAREFELALVDLQTQGRNGEEGLDLVDRMRALRGGGELAILAVAEQSATEDAAEALARGADDCLFRPLHVDLAHARAEMLARPRGRASTRKTKRGELQARLDNLEEAAVRTEAVSAALVEIGLDGIAPINGLLGATSVITTLCRTAKLGRAIERIDAAASALDLVMVRALGRADRRNRAPKSKLKVLSADHDAASRRALRGLLDAAEVEVELTCVDGGSQAVLATDTRFFDLIVLNLAGPEELAGIQAIRRAERQNKTRRTPVLALGVEGRSAADALNAGADLYMRPPVSAERMLSALADALARESEVVRAVA